MGERVILRNCCDTRQQAIEQINELRVCLHDFMIGQVRGDWEEILPGIESVEQVRADEGILWCRVLELRGEK